MARAKTPQDPGQLQGLVLRRGRGSPLYVQLADAVERAIEDGQVVPGDRLPRHHDLASDLDVNITTVTKAFAILKGKGLVDSKPGRGTVVRPMGRRAKYPFQTVPADRRDVVDLSVNRPATNLYLSSLAKLLPELAADERFVGIADYQAADGPRWARSAAATWISEFGPSVDPQQVLITGGAQHALAATMSAFGRVGDTVLADNVTYQGINALCRVRNLELRGVPGDEEGMSPDALDAACADRSARILFLVPSLHNPTTTTLSEQRRQALVDVARRHGLLVVEDDVYAPLLETRPPSIATLYSERTIYVSGLSKCVAPGLRAGFLAAPHALVPELAAAIRIDCWSMSPLTSLIATKLIGSGKAAAIVEAQRAELMERNRITRDALRGLDLASQDTSTHAWLSLPAPWRGNNFAAACEQYGVRVLAAEAFTLGHAPAPHAVRLNLAAARTHEDLAEGLKVLRKVLDLRHLHAHSFV